MKNNNGKVAIAIVAMFVVALSVVGFTYAYFTAQIQGNQNPVSVDVGAGIMKVSYDHGYKLAATNLVPGWISDGLHYYDPVLSVVDVEENGKTVRKITAATLNSDGTLKAGSGLETAPVYNAETPSMVSRPVEFTVDNTGTQVAKYAINLNIKTNGFEESDKDNLVVYLVEGAWTAGEITAESLASKTALKVFDAQSNVLVLDKYEELAVGADKTYHVILEYKNVDAPQASTNRTFSAEVEVVGLGQDATEENPAA